MEMEGLGLVCVDSELERREHIGGPLRAASQGGLALERMRAPWLRGQFAGQPPHHRKCPMREPALGRRGPTLFSDKDRGL